MDMTVVLGIFTFLFFVTLFLMCFYRSKINVRLCNVIFIIADFVAFSCWNYSYHLKGWLDGGWLTLGNISPLMFTLILLTPFMNERVRENTYSTLACLSVGMFFAMLISPEHDYIFNFNTEASFTLTSEALSHMVCSLYGIYLVLSKQVKADFKHWAKSIRFLLSIITFGVIINFVYHKNNFGMDPYGTPRIYMLDIFGSFWATLIAYYFGVVLVLTLGYQVTSGLDKATARFFEHSEPKTAAPDVTAPDVTAPTEEIPEVKEEEIPEYSREIEEIFRLAQRFESRQDQSQKPKK